MRHLSALTALLILSCAPASACIWDSELPKHEREFRSSYDKTTTKPARSSTTQYIPWAAGGTGAVLLSVASFLAIRKSARS